MTSAEWVEAIAWGFLVVAFGIGYLCGRVR